MNQPVNTILSATNLQVALSNEELLERLRALRGSGGGSGGGGVIPTGIKADTTQYTADTTLITADNG